MMSLKQIRKLEVICCHFLSHQTFIFHREMLKFHILMNQLHNHVQWRLHNRAAVMRRGAKQECYPSKLEHWSLFWGFFPPSFKQHTTAVNQVLSLEWSPRGTSAQKHSDMINYCSPWGPLSPAEAPLSKPGPDCLSSPATHKMGRTTVHLDTIDHRFWSELSFVERKSTHLTRLLFL